MNIEDLETLLPKIKKNALQSLDAHKMLAPPNREFTIVERGNPRIASVLALLFPIGNEVHLLLIKRATYRGNHSGQIAFPGGKQEKLDTTNWDTAIREAEEEVGVKGIEINLIKKLTPVYVTVSNYKVFPFIGTINYTPKFVLQKSEVADLVKIPLSEFLKFRIKLVNVSDQKNKELVVPAFVYKNHSIWGATAMMLNELKMLFIEAME